MRSRCPFCSEVMYHFYTWGDQEYVRCRHCGFVRLLTSREGITRIHRKSIDPPSVLSERSSHRTPVFHALAEEIASLITDGKVLDIGCSTGDFLRIMKGYGYDCYGVELNKPLAEYARESFGANIRIAPVEKANFPEDFFDLVTLWEVIEHTANPGVVLKECFRILKKGGLLCMIVPNFTFSFPKERLVLAILRTFSRERAKRHRFLQGETHPNWFTTSSLVKVVGGIGFRIFNIGPTDYSYPSGILINLGLQNLWLNKFLSWFRLFYNSVARMFYRISKINIGTNITLYAFK